MEHALDHPAGLRAIVVADSPARIPLWVEEANRLRADLPPDVQETLTRHEADGTTDDAGVRGRRCASSTTGTSAACRGPTTSSGQLRADGRGPDRLPHDERPERVPLHRLAEDVGHHRPAARDHDADAARLRAATTRRRRTSSSRSTRASRARSGRSSRSRATCRTSRSRRRFLETVEAFLKTID